MKSTEAPVGIPMDQPEDVSSPTSSWSPEAVDLYNRLNEGTSSGEWQKVHSAAEERDTIRSFIRAAGDKMFLGAIFVCNSKQIAKGVIKFGSWCEGGPK